MKDYVERMLKEHSELNEKVTKLEDFINKNCVRPYVSLEQLDLMYAQLHAMKSYLFILARRIDIENKD